jgi:hypothetical protein
MQTSDLITMGMIAHEHIETTRLKLYSTRVPPFCCCYVVFVIVALELIVESRFLGGKCARHEARILIGTHTDGRWDGDTWYHGEVSKLPQMYHDTFSVSW